MANEIQLRYTDTGDTLYATIRDASNQYWDVVASEFESLDTSAWSDYVVSMTETPAGGYTYIADFPGISSAGKYTVDIFEQSDAAPVLSDTLYAVAEVEWNGSNEITLQAVADNVSDVTVIGSGALSTTITVDDGTNPLDGVEVWITTDEAGSNVIAGSLTTDANGQVTFMLDAGTYYVWQQLAGYDFTNPQTITVSQ